MNIFNSMADKIRQGIRTWLRIQPAQIGSIQLNEVLDYEANAIKTGYGTEVRARSYHSCIHNSMGIRQDFGRQNVLREWR